MGALIYQEHDPVARVDRAQDRPVPVHDIKYANAWEHREAEPKLDMSVAVL